MSLVFEFDLEKDGYRLIKIYENGYGNHRTVDNGRWKTSKCIKVWEKDGLKVAELSLTQGKTTLVDFEDLDKVCTLNWCAAKDSDWGYRVMTSLPKSEGHVLLHNVVLECEGIVDHINYDYPDSYALDNRKSNLRETKHNTHNVRKYKNNTTGYPNIISSRNGKYNVQVTIDLKRPYCPYVESLEEALQVRDMFKLILHKHNDNISKGLLEEYKNKVLELYYKEILPKSIPEKEVIKLFSKLKGKGYDLNMIINELKEK